MKQVARGLAGYGRNGDNNLVHVSDQELRGIEQLTGRKFTRNPDTGLPEAFSFGDALKMAVPVIAGIAATAMTGGAAAPLVGAAASGLASAGMAKAEGKSTEDALTKGLISGVTSYAGGQLLSGVGDAANAAAGAAASETAGAAAQGAAGAINTGSAGVGGSVPFANPGFTGQAIAPSAASDATSAGISAMGPKMNAQQALDFSATGTASPTIGQRISASPAYISSAGDTAANIAQNPGASLSQIGSNIMARPQTALVAAGGTYAGLSGMGSSNQPKMPGTDTYDPNKYPEQFPTNPRRYVAPPSGYRAGIDPEYRYFAKGGLASMRQEGGMTENVVNEAKAALLGEHPKPQDALSRFEGMFGRDALAVLRDRITGGRVKGAGGGMDDLIPGTIEGRQKVRLADGEFVIPSDVVSGIGDGSTDQGVRRLHEMMNKVRKERTGKTAQPKAIGGKISL